MRLIDLSIAIAADEHDPMKTEIQRFDHATGADMLGGPAGLSREDFPGGLGLSLEVITTTTHVGTHIDAPSHYGPTSEGKPARHIDDMPLDWFFGEGRLVDCRNQPIDQVISVEEVADQLGNGSLHGQIILLMTGADRLLGSAEYYSTFRGVGRQATAWMVERGARVIGIDTFGFDAPFPTMLKAYSISGNQGDLWPAHIYGREREYCQIERLANLDKIPTDRSFKICCFPVKIEQAGAGWSRVVAMVED